MKAALERLANAWRNLPQSTKILLAGLLLVSAVTLWYVGFYLPAQTTEAPPAPTLPQEEAEAPKAIEAPPIPPLAEPQPQGAPPTSPTPPSQTPPSAQAPAQAVAAPIPRATRESPPPNPFVPLVVEGPAPTPLPTPAPAPAPQPVPTGAPVRVSPGTALPTPRVSTAPRPLPGTAGALPAPKVLTPSPRAEIPPAQVEPEVALTPPSGLVETPLPQEARPTPEATTPPGPAPLPKTPLQALVEEKALKLSGTLLGPVSVAILESKEGYLVLPVGSPIPGSEAVVRRIEGDRVVLALKDETLEIVLANVQAGGGQ
jgi:hypothetical protein